MSNIFMDNRSIIEDISKRNITPEGVKHADGLEYRHIDMSVASSMFAADLRSGANLYYPIYPMGVAERFKAMTPDEMPSRRRSSATCIDNAKSRRAVPGGGQRPWHLRSARLLTGNCNNF